nr:hypothetical protein [Tanacetum cinerariifolium]
MTNDHKDKDKLGGLYCLYCLHETQPFKPPFRIYLSPWQLKRLKELVAHAKEKNIELVYRFVNNMIDRNLFPYRASEFNEGYIKEEASELINVENACAQHPNKRLKVTTKKPSIRKRDLTNAKCGKTRAKNQREH